ncbi:MAG: disulfide bond formation protein B, partial [Pseudomonadota bacterium]
LRMTGQRFRLLVAATGGASLLLVAAAVALTHLLELNPCPLCILQRVIDIALGVLLLGVAAVGAAARWVRPALALALALASGGVAVAGYQSWLQWSPPPLSCGPASQGPVEWLVAWLGERVPWLFLATGACESKELSILGLSLANWSLAAYFAFAALIVVLLRAHRRLHRDTYAPHRTF